ncbi:hypothetical protein [Arthrobacter mangrovi]|uniref:Uncharacterized protein n=1 Tax=Arthrobacter mangrovi TaxID=2966350 RepID=A0ABQ5MWV9_9MICC|nr:hypothetical protein [Arthrobacter mangrovi]GLB68448.1 hypothetical protein AHIS1636_28900 [Arthrobacter mangrovi]
MPATQPSPQPDSQPGSRPSSDKLKEILSRIFDSQIPNHGDYNLVFGSTGHHGWRTPAPGKGRTFVIGYRWRPLELVIAPFDGTRLTAGGTPSAINMTNLSHAVELNGGGYEVGTNTGTTFRFGVQPRGQLPAAGCVVEQDEDSADFSRFMDGLIAAA